MVTDADLAGMRAALDVARAAVAWGDVPVGAAVVRDGDVIALAGNEREKLADPTAHAEILAVRRAARAAGTWRLTGMTVYVTLEPCPMCAGAILAGRLDRLVYGATDPKAGAACSLYNLLVDPRLHHEVAVTPGVLAEEAAALLTEFFTARRPGASGALRP